MPIKELRKVILDALDEDLNDQGDITSNLIIAEDKQIKFQISNREKIILCGVDVLLMVFEIGEEKFNKKIKITKKFSDGKLLKKNSVIIKGEGNARLIFACERVALNLIQHLSGIATITNQFVKKLANKKTKILDSRKTLPSLRALQKYAVKVGGGQNHRFGLYDGILIKDNHIIAAGGVEEAINMAKNNLNHKKMPIEVECDNLEQVKASLEAGVEIIMLDNMNLNQIKQAIKIIGKKAKIEVSGGVTLDKIKSISKLGVDYISIGYLTHSVKASDIGLDLIE